MQSREKKHIRNMSTIGKITYFLVIKEVK
jgi:hypothetical protein